MYRIIVIVIISFSGFLLTSCSRTVTRVDPSTQIDLSGRWNDSDSRKVADQMIYDLFNSPAFSEYARQLDRKPAIIVGTVENRTSEHIDVNGFIRKFELVIHNSQSATVVESEEFRDQLRRERLDQQDFADPATAKQFGKELGADLMLLGELISETDTYGNKRVVNYQTSLFLTDIETGRHVWFGQHEIKKYIKN